MGVSGAGGNGGSLISNSVNFGEQFTAGNGGTGAFGGNGGSIIGINKTGFYDTLDTFITIISGNGANGVKSGGNGGSITNFHSSFNFPVIGGAAGSFEITAGSGGNASSGPGGNGGSITNDGPLQDAANPGNFMAGDILLQSGLGGNGLRGGNGGSITTFVDQPNPTTSSPTLLSILAGNGGNGISGAGGHGGGIRASNIPSTGQVSTNLSPQLTPYNYDTWIIAGNGGLSAGGTGGAGGKYLQSHHHE